MDQKYDHEGAKLISESAWLRIYELAPNNSRYESKFLTDGLEINAARFFEAWPNFSRHERWEFAMAYGSKPTMTVEDEKILNYLMGEAGRDIWWSLPMILVRYPDRARVLQFLQDRIEEANTSKANYYQVVGLMHAVEMGP